MRIRLNRPLIVAGAVLAGVLVLTAVVDGFARSAFRAEVREEVSSRLDGLARSMSDAIARETASAGTMAAFVELNGFDAGALQRTFPMFAAALMQDSASIRSVQIAPGGILDFVHPLAGNEAALGLDLFADAGRRANLLPAIESGRSVIQGPFELVQGGQALAVRHPLYTADASFWGFAAVILDWPSVMRSSGFDAIPSDFWVGVRLPGDAAVIAGESAAFHDDPLLRAIRVGATDTTWELALRPTNGWPVESGLTRPIWLVGVVVAWLAALVTHSTAKRPLLLEQQRREAIADLVRSEAMFQATFLHAGVGIVIGDVSGRIVSANPAFRAIVGRGDDMIEGDEVLAFIADEDRRLFEREMIRAYRRSEVITAEVRLARSGTPHWGRIQVTTIPGSERLFVGIVEDITDRFLAELALAESEERFRHLFEQAPIAIQREDHSAVKTEIDRLHAAGISDVRAWLDEDERRFTALLGSVVVADLNPAARRLHEDRLGLVVADGPLLQHYTPLAREGFLRTIEAMAAGATELEYDATMTDIHGELVHLDLKWQVAVVDGVPDYSNVTLTLHDSTELTRAQRELQREVASKDRFLASVAHELRTPLTAVVGFAHELQSGAHDEDREEFQNLIAFHSAELAHLIEDLLVWARADIGEVQVRSTVVDLGETVAECVASLPGVDIVVDWQPAAMAHADPSRIRQIVRNLASNAMRYGGSDRRVAVHADGDWAIVEVSDDGPELSDVQMEGVFAPYARSEGSASMPGSIGLGLTVSRTLGRLLGGDLVFVREADRNVFRLTLPTASEVSPLTAVSLVP